MMLLSFEGGFDFWKQLRPLEATCSSSREAWQSPAWIELSGPGPRRAGACEPAMWPGSSFLKVSLPERSRPLCPGRGTAPQRQF